LRGFLLGKEVAMTDTTVFVVTAIVAIVTVILFMRSSSSRSLTEQKRADVQRKRAQLMAKRKAEAQEAANQGAETQTETQN
jgi:uncharacterized membrane protein